MPSKDMIGRLLSTGSATANAEHVAAFADALDDGDPRYRGPNAVAPPTYPIAFMVQAMSGGMDTFQELGLNFMTLVHGEQEFVYHRPIMVGDVLVGEGKVVDLYERESKGKVMTFLITENVYRDEKSGQPVLTTRMNLIHRR